MVRDNGIINTKFDISSFNIIDTNNNILLEDKISEFCKTNYCVSTCNGTSAILLSLIAFGLKENDEIILPTFGYYAAYTCAKFLKLKIKFCEINENTMCLDSEKLKEIISDSTKCVVFINHLGYVGEELNAVSNICSYYDCRMLEDSAQGFSHSHDNKYAGTFGDIGIFSFSGTKLLRCGEGGCLITKDLSLYEKTKELRDMGIGNYTLSPLSAKLISTQLNCITDILSTRQEIQNVYKKNDINIISFDTNVSSIHSSSLYIEDAEKLHIFLKSRDIETRYKFYSAFSEHSKNVLSKFIELPQSSTQDAQIASDKINDFYNSTKVDISNFKNILKILK